MRRHRRPQQRGGGPASKHKKTLVRLENRFSIAELPGLKELFGHTHHVARARAQPPCPQNLRPPGVWGLGTHPLGAP
eukprot:11211509-Lingulodinium_polyedra.AAC.1